MHGHEHVAPIVHQGLKPKMPIELGGAIIDRIHFDSTNAYLISHKACATQSIEQKSLAQSLPLCKTINS